MPVYASALRGMGSDSPTSLPATFAETSPSSTRLVRYRKCCMHVDGKGWSGEGDLLQVVVDRLRTIDQVASIKVQDAPATRSEADYNFIANEIFVTFATRIEHEPIKRLESIPGTRPVAVTVMTFAKMLEESDGIGPADYADEGVIQYLRTERIIPPYQTKGYKLVELVRICEAK